MPDTIEPPSEDAKPLTPTPDGAWHRLMGAMGRDLQGGLYRAEMARRRMAGRF